MILATKGLWDLGMEDSNVEKLHYALLLLKYVKTRACHGPSKKTPGSKLPEWVQAAWRRCLEITVCPLLRSAASLTLLRTERMTLSQK